MAGLVLFEKSKTHCLSGGVVLCCAERFGSRGLVNAKRRWKLTADTVFVIRSRSTHALFRSIELDGLLP